MSTQGRRFLAVTTWAWLLCLPAVAGAQSVISGVVTDSTQGALPGVSVEASSPALIEKVRTVVTDGAGVYRIENLPPGTYSVSFNIQGFSPIRREGLELPSNFTATVNTTMQLGTVGETIVVTGESPVVDTSSTARSNVVSREMLDVLPSGRTVQTAGALVHTTVMSAPDVGGTGAMTQNHQTTAGMERMDLTVTVDGIQMQGIDDNGASQAYTSPIDYEEIVFESAAGGAEYSAGGIRQHLIPRRGGNMFSGQLSTFYMNREWQGNPLTPELAARGLQRGPSLDGLNNVEGGIGGPIFRDKLWFWGSARRMVANRVVPGAFYNDGSPGIALDKVTNEALRLTWQASERNQVTAYYNWVVKDQLLGVAANSDVAAIARPSHSSPYALAQVKWTNTLTNKLMFEAGMNDYRAYRQTSYAEGVYQEPFTPEWYAMANRTDTVTQRQTTASAAGHYIIEPARRFIQATGTYATGSHSVKFGFQNSWGRIVEGTVRNADLNQQYQNGVPFQAVIYNTPVRARANMDRNIGLFVQDQWRLHRLSLNGGIRWEDYRSSIGEQDTGLGRFVPARQYAGETLPAWRGWAPRFGATYDVFGNAKTALKFSVNRFQSSLTTGLASDLSPVREQSANVGWTDLNGDDIAQNNELNLAQLPANFGIVRPGCSIIYNPAGIPCGNDTVDPDIERTGSWHYNVSVQHELLPRVSVTAGWVHSTFDNLRASDNVLRTFADYTPVDIVSPMDGSVITIYNVSTEKRNQVLNVQTNRPDRSRQNNSYDFGFNARIRPGMTIFGGGLVYRTLDVSCDAADDPNRLLFCDQSKADIPWLSQYKVAGTLPLHYGVMFSAAFQSYNRYLGTGGQTPTAQGTVWQITPTTRYAANCTGPCTPGALVNPTMTLASMNVPLETVQSRVSDRIYQVDLTFSKSFRVGGLDLRPEVSIFNALNNLAVYSVRSLNYGTAAYLVPSEVLQPRLFRIGFQAKW